MTGHTKVKLSTWAKAMGVSIRTAQRQAQLVKGRPMDHHDLTSRIANRFLSPGQDEAVRALSEKQAQDVIRDRVARGAFEGALLELAQTGQSREDLEEVAEDIREALSGELKVMAKRLTDTVFSKMDRPMSSGKLTYSNGMEEDSWGGLTSVWYEIDYPSHIVFQQGLKTKAHHFLKEVMADRYLSNHKLKDVRAWAEFIKNPAVKQWLDQKWSLHTDDVKVPFSLHEKAEQAVYDNAEEEVTTTVYSEDGGEEEIESGELKWVFYMHDPKVEISKMKFDGREFILRFKVTFPVGSVLKARVE